MLDRNLAHLYPDTSQHFFLAAERNGSPIALIIDGFNECPQKVEEISAQGSPGFLSPASHADSDLLAQQPIPVADELAGVITVLFEPLTEEQRADVLKSYVPDGLPERIEMLCMPFRSPYELSLAAECLAQIGGKTSRGMLFHAYVRRHCDRIESRRHRLGLAVRHRRTHAREAGKQPEHG